MKKISVISLFVASMLIMAACMKDEIDVKDTTYNRSLNFAAPVFNVAADYMTIFNSLSDKSQHESIIYADDDGMLYVEYSTDYSVRWNSIVNLDTYNDSYSISVPTVSGENVNQLFEFPHKMNADNTTRIDSVIISKAKLKLSASALPIAGTATLKINELSINGNILSTSWEIDEGLEQTIDLSGYYLKPKQVADSSYTNCKIRMVGVCDKTAVTDFNFKIEMVDIDPKVAFGFFGQNEVFNQSGMQHLGFFSEYKVPSAIKLKGMRINLTVDNHTGTSFNLQMDDMHIKCDDDETIDVRFLENNNIFVDQIRYEDFLVNGTVDPKHNQYLLDSANSNCDEILNSSPLDFFYTLKIESNPQGEVQENFITPETQLDAKVDVFIPFWFCIYDLGRQDTINFNINDIILGEDNAMYIDTMKLSFKFSNGFPLSFSTQGYLTDENYNVVDSLFADVQKLWKMPDFDENLRVSKWGVLDTDIIMDAEKVVRCSEGNVKYVILNTKVTTQEMPGKYFRLYDNYGLNMRFAVDVVGKYKSE